MSRKLVSETFFGAGGVIIRSKSENPNTDQSYTISEKKNKKNFLSKYFYMYRRNLKKNIFTFFFDYYVTKYGSLEYEKRKNMTVIIHYSGVVEKISDLSS